MELVLAEPISLRGVLRAAFRAEVRLRRVHLVDDCEGTAVVIIVVKGTNATRESRLRASREGGQAGGQACKGSHLLAYSSTIFFLARSRTSSSMVSLLTNR